MNYTHLHIPSPSISGRRGEKRECTRRSRSGQVDAGQKLDSAEGSTVGNIQIEGGDGRPAELNLDSTAVPGGDLSQVMRLFSFNFSLYTDSRLCQNSICLIFKRFDLTPILIQFAPIANMQFWNVKKKLTLFSSALLPCPLSDQPDENRWWSDNCRRSRRGARRESTVCPSHCHRHRFNPCSHG